MRPTHVRYWILALLACAPFCAYLTRVMSAFTTTMEKEFQVGSTELGDVISGFALGYFVFQIPGGMLASALGVRAMLTTFGGLWSACAIVASFAESADELYFARVALGVAQAGLVPCCAKAIADWFPLSRRGVVGALMNGTMQVGGILATGLSARLLTPVGWRMLVRSYGVVGMIWAMAFLWWYRNRPVEKKGVNLAEIERIEEGRVVSTTRERQSWRDWWFFLRRAGGSLSLWAFCFSALFRAYAYEFFLTWCPAYLERAYDLDKQTAGELAVWPMIAFGIGSVLSGFVVDYILRRTRNRWLSRCGVAIFGLTACAACLALATQIRDPRLVTLVLSIGCLGTSMASPCTWAAGMDLGGRWTPVVFGMMNMCGNIGSYCEPKQIGVLMDEIRETGGSWAMVLWLLCGINIASALMWMFVNPSKAIGEQKPVEANSAGTVEESARQ